MPPAQPTVIYLTAVALATGATMWAWSQPAAHLHVAMARTDLVNRIFQTPAEDGPGGLAHLYTNGSAGIHELPAFQLLLIGATRLGGLLGLNSPTLYQSPTTYATYQVGGIWGFDAAVAYLGGLVAIFPVETLARRVGLGGWRRLAAVLLAAVTLMWMGVWWGHPEYGAALAFLLWGVIAIHDGHWEGAGWLIGAAVACQTLVLLAVPFYLVLAGRRWFGFALRAVVPGLVSVAIPVVGDLSATWQGLVTQPRDTGGALFHPTPWLDLVHHPAHAVRLVGEPGGPGRALAFAVATVIGVTLARRLQRHRSDLVVLLWMTAVLVAMRNVFGAVDFPYYLAPVVVLLAIPACRQSLWKFATALTVAGVAAWTGGWPMSPWVYWAALMVSLAALAAVTAPLPWRSASCPTGHLGAEARTSATV